MSVRFQDRYFKKKKKKTSRTVFVNLYQSRSCTCMWSITMGPIYSILWILRLWSSWKHTHRGAAWTEGGLKRLKGKDIFFIFYFYFLKITKRCFSLVTIFLSFINHLLMSGQETQPPTKKKKKNCKEYSIVVGHLPLSSFSSLMPLDRALI